MITLPDIKARLTVRPNEAAALLGVSRRSIERAIRDGRLRSTKTIGGPLCRRRRAVSGRCERDNRAGVRLAPPRVSPIKPTPRSLPSSSSGRGNEDDGKDEERAMSKSYQSGNGGHAGARPPHVPVGYRGLSGLGVE